MILITLTFSALTQASTLEIQAQGPVNCPKWAAIPMARTAAIMTYLKKYNDDAVKKTISSKMLNDLGNSYLVEVHLEGLPDVTMLIRVNNKYCSIGDKIDHYNSLADINIIYEE